MDAGSGTLQGKPQGDRRMPASRVMAACLAAGKLSGN